MVYKNALFHNVAEIFHNDDGSISWKRVPTSVHHAMQAPHADSVVYNSTGVELRFIIKSGSAVIKMSSYNQSATSCSFHIYRGGIQGGWQDHEIHKFVGIEPEEFVIEKSTNIEHLKVMSNNSGYSWSPEVIRIVFDRGRYKIYDIIGDIEPPEEDMCPQKSLLAYGSSITHGSNSIDASHSWVSVLSHNLNMDAINLGMAGSCALEKQMADYIAQLGENGKWDVAILELGINVLGWESEKIIERVDYIIKKVAVTNPEKKIFVISPFYYCAEFFLNDKSGEKWRKIIEERIKEHNLKNIFYINGFEILNNMSYISADEVHPNIYGVQRIAEFLTERLKNILNK